MFLDRVDAGRKLARALKQFEGQDIVVYGLPRGGAIVAAEVARALDAPLELIIARKLGHPSWPEYAVGAVTEKGQSVWNETERANLNPSQQKQLVDQERTEAKRRRLKYIGKRPFISPKNKTAIIVDDGMATGLTMMAAASSLRELEPKTIIAALPVAPEDTASELEEYVDQIVVLHSIPTESFGSVGQFYNNFEQTEDYEVQEIMEEFYS